MTRHRKTPADLRREALANAGLRAPNLRLFKFGDDHARTWCHPPCLRPTVPRQGPPPLTWTGDNPFPWKSWWRMSMWKQV